jgi:4-hydroxy-3-methylbut-2-enyl diphosphate reductase
MKISLAKSAGFCFGVKRAIDIAYKMVKGNSAVYMLGDIVHNEEVAKDLRKVGIKKIKRLSRGKGKIFLIRAHGTSAKIIKKACGLNYRIVDATCPMVKEIHRIARKMEGDGYTIIIIGDKKHDEVLGIVGQLKNKAIIIDRPENIPLLKIRKIKKAAIVVQSTQNIEKVMLIVRILRDKIKDLIFFNTVCRPTRVKQEEIKKMPKENDVMIIIGSKTSANTKRLYEISKSLNENSYWIRSKNDLKSAWFRGAESVGVSAGASTPDETVREVVDYLRTLD